MMSKFYKIYYKIWKLFIIRVKVSNLNGDLSGDQWADQSSKLYEGRIE